MKTERKREILTFGPVSILPEYQRNGYGKMLIEHSAQRALELGYDVIVIFGSPANYVSCGFECCKKHNVCVEGRKISGGDVGERIENGGFGREKVVLFRQPGDECRRKGSSGV